METLVNKVGDGFVTGSSVLLISTSINVLQVALFLRSEPTPRTTCAGVVCFLMKFSMELLTLIVLREFLNKAVVTSRCLRADVERMREQVMRLVTTHLADAWLIAEVIPDTSQRETLFESAGLEDLVGVDTAKAASQQAFFALLRDPRDFPRLAATEQQLLKPGAGPITISEVKIGPGSSTPPIIVEVVGLGLPAQTYSDSSAHGSLISVRKAKVCWVFRRRPQTESNTDSDKNPEVTTGDQQMQPPTQECASLQRAPHISTTSSEALPRDVGKQRESGLESAATKELKLEPHVETTRPSLPRPAYGHRKGPIFVKTHLQALDYLELPLAVVDNPPSPDFPRHDWYRHVWASKACLSITNKNSMKEWVKSGVLPIRTGPAGISSKLGDLHHRVQSRGETTIEVETTYDNEIPVNVLSLQMPFRVLPKGLPPVPPGTVGEEGERILNLSVLLHAVDQYQGAPVEEPSLARRLGEDLPRISASNLSILDSLTGLSAAVFKFPDDAATWASFDTISDPLCFGRDRLWCSERFAARRGMSVNEWILRGQSCWDRSSLMSAERASSLAGAMARGSRVTFQDVVNQPATDSWKPELVIVILSSVYWQSTESLVLEELAVLRCEVAVGGEFFCNPSNELLLSAHAWMHASSSLSIYDDQGHLLLRNMAAHQFVSGLRAIKGEKFGNSLKDYFEGNEAALKRMRRATESEGAHWQESLDVLGGSRFMQLTATRSHPPVEQNRKVLLVAALDISQSRSMEMKIEGALDVMLSHSCFDASLELRVQRFGCLLVVQSDPKVDHLFGVPALGRDLQDFVAGFQEAERLHQYVLRLVSQTRTFDLSPSEISTAFTSAAASTQCPTCLLTGSTSNAFGVVITFRSFRKGHFAEAPRGMSLPQDPLQVQESLWEAELFGMQLEHTSGIQEPGDFRVRLLLKVLDMRELPAEADAAGHGDVGTTNLNLDEDYSWDARSRLSQVIQHPNWSTETTFTC